jgi:hypothetical protein
VAEQELTVRYLGDPVAAMGPVLVGSERLAA